MAIKETNFTMDLTREGKYPVVKFRLNDNKVQKITFRLTNNGQEVDLEREIGDQFTPVFECIFPDKTFKRDEDQGNWEIKRDATGKYPLYTFTYFLTNEVVNKSGIACYYFALETPEGLRISTPTLKMVIDCDFKEEGKPSDNYVSEWEKLKKEADRYRKTVKDLADTLQEVLEGGESITEVIVARENADGQHFDNIKARLDDSDSKVKKNTKVITQINEEVIQARRDINGTDHPKLKDRLDRIEINLEDVGINLRDFAIKGQVNHTEQFQNALDAAKNQAQAKGGGRATVIVPHGEYTITSPLSVDVGYVNMKSTGAMLHWAGGDEAMLVLEGEFDRSWYQNFTVLENITLQSNGKYGTGLLLKGDRTNSEKIGRGPSHVIVKSVNIKDFKTGITFGDNTYINKFIDVEISGCNSGIDVYQRVNSGERILFDNSNIYNNNTGIYSEGEFNMHFSSCSFDYNVQQMYIKRGSVFVDNCSLETSHTEKTHFLLQRANGADKSGYPSLSIVNSVYTFYATPEMKIPVFDIDENMHLSLVGNAFQYPNGLKMPYLVYGKGEVYAAGNNYNRANWSVSEKLNIIPFKVDKNFKDSFLQDVPPGFNKPKLVTDEYETDGASLMFYKDQQQNNCLGLVGDIKANAANGNKISVLARFLRREYSGAAVIKIIFNGRNNFIGAEEIALPKASSGWTTVAIPINAIPACTENISVGIQTVNIPDGQSFLIDKFVVNII